MEAKTAGQLVMEARQRIQNLTAAQVEAEIARGGVTVVDIREAEELASGMLPGAVHVPRGLLEFRAEPTSPAYRGELKKGSRIILYCASGGRSALAADILQQMGYTNVAHLDGGLKMWVAEGNAIERR